MPELAAKPKGETPAATTKRVRKPVAHNLCLEQRIQNYVERYWFRENMTAWPTIRTIARGLNVGIRAVFDAVEGDHRCDTQGWNVVDVNIADLEVYTSTPKTEEAWNRYWGRVNQESNSGKTQASQLATH